MNSLPKIDFNRLWSCNIGNPLLIFGNEYGYRLNINHEVIRPLYDKYKREVLNTPRAEFPISDRERIEFEDKLIPYLIRKGYLKYEG